MTDREKPAVIVVDDDEVYRMRLCSSFRLRGWEAGEAGEARSALTLAQQTGPDLAVVDLRMPGESGLEVVRRLRAFDTTVAILIVTGYGSIATALEAIKRGADHYLTKPVDVDQIISAYESARSTGCSAQKEPESVPSLARVEWEHIQRVLADCNGNVSQAARLLGIHRRSLQRKLYNKYPPRN
jgi:two-component system, response regulator RegA